jgi:uncharacterized protein YdaU (DUF1376 family)
MQTDFPITPILRAADEHRLTTLQLGALVALADSFWKGKASPLPTSHAQLMRLANVHGRQWHEIAPVVVAAWQSIESTMTSLYVKVAACSAAKSAGARKANEVRRMARASLSMDKLSDLEAGNARLVPATSNQSRRVVTENVALSD